MAWFSFARDNRRSPVGVGEEEEAMQESWRRQPTTTNGP
jgi:hypothetical protein